MEKLLTELFSVRPDSVVGIVHHAAMPGAPPDTGSTLRRIDPALVISDLGSAGFELDGENTADDHTTLVFDPAIRGKTDRLVLRFRNPAGTAADTAQ
jgi:predicted methyltransferase